MNPLAVVTVGELADERATMEMTTASDCVVTTFGDGVNVVVAEADPLAGDVVATTGSARAAWNFP